MTKDYVYKLLGPTISLLLAASLSGCDTFKKVITNSYTLHGKYVDYDCNPIKNKTVKVVNHIELNQFLTAGTSSVSTDTTNSDGEFQLKLYEGHHSIIRLDNIYHYELNKVDLEQLENKSTSKDRIYFYKPYKSNNYLFLPEFREWININHYKNIDHAHPSPLSLSSGNGGRTVSVSSKIIGDNVGWEILIRAKDGFLIKKQNDYYDGHIPTTGYQSSIFINITNNEVNNWKQYNYFVKSIDQKIYGAFSLDIAVLSYDIAPNYGKHGMRVVYIWSHGEFIRSAKSTYSNSNPEHSQYVQLDKLLPIEKPYIPIKNCGNRPGFYNSQFIRHPAPSKTDIRFWEERKAYYKENNAKQNTQ